MPASDEFKQTIGKALGRVPSGVFILTARDAAGASAAMLASWVQQAAFDPPAISVALAKARPIGEMIRSTRRLAISILGQHDAQLMKRYARGTELGEDAFAGVNIIEPHGVPVLADALAYLDCHLLQACEFGADHELFIAEVFGGKLLHEGPSFTHTRGNGFHY